MAEIKREKVSRKILGTKFEMLEAWVKVENILVWNMEWVIYRNPTDRKLFVKH